MLIHIISAAAAATIEDRGARGGGCSTSVMIGSIGGMRWYLRRSWRRWRRWIRRRWLLILSMMLREERVRIKCAVDVRLLSGRCCAVERGGSGRRRAAIGMMMSINGRRMLRLILTVAGCVEVAGCIHFLIIIIGKQFSLTER